MKSSSMTDMIVHRHTLRAFTIIEAMVALVLTALAISFVYTALRFVKQHQEGLTSQLNAFGEFSQLHRAMQADAAMADEIRLDDLGIALHLSNRTIHYYASDSLCIRYDGAVAVTFRIQVDSVACWFEGQRLASVGDLADQSVFYFSKRDNPLPVAIQKRYDAASLIQLTPPSSHE